MSTRSTRCGTASPRRPGCGYRRSAPSGCATRADAQAASALDAALASLRCPVCGAALRRDGGALRCTAGHAYDVARQGYATLRSGRAGPGTGDTPAMVAARERFLAGGHYAPLTRALTAAADVPAAVPGIVLDLACGTGQHLAAVLDPLAHRVGVGVDLAAAALRRAARAHPRAAAIGADAWDTLPVRDGAAAVVLSVFGPRDAAEIRRVLAPGGVLVTAMPEPEHLAEIVAPLGLLTVDPDKARRRAAAFAAFDEERTIAVRHTLTLGHEDLAALAGMGPTGAHATPEELAARVARLPEPTPVSVAVEVTRWRSRRSADAARCADS